MLNNSLAVKKAFFQWKSFNEIEDSLRKELEKEIEKDPDLIQFQDDFIRETIKSEIIPNSKFPVHPECRCAFLKKIVKLLEELNVEVHEDIYMSCNLNEQEILKPSDYFKSYFSSNSSYLCSLIETKEFVVQGTTGLKTWPAAEFLINFLLNNKYVQRDFTILELGSGIGLAGISLLKLKKARKIYFTDHHQSVLDTLKINLTKNEISEKNYIVQKLDWEHPEDIPKSDLVIGSDIVFDPGLITSLVNTIVLAMKTSKMTIIANVERNMDTRYAFEESLIQHKLDFTVEKSAGEMLLYIITWKK